MEFRRIDALPPYVFATIDALKMEARRAGEDVVDLGFGNPDLAPPPIAVDKVCEAIRNPRNHRYSMSRGIPKLRLAITDLYQRKFGVELDPETQACTTIGAKEGFSHLMWVLLGPGDAAMVPSPSYPIHIWGPLFAGAEIRHVRLGPEHDFFENLRRGLGGVVAAAEGDRPLVPAQPDDRVRRPRVHAAHGRLRPRARRPARARLRLRRSRVRRVRAAVDPAGPRGVRRRRRALHAHEVVLDGRLAHGLHARQRRGRRRARRSSRAISTTARSNPMQIAATVAMNEAPDFPREVNAIYRGRRDALVDGLARTGWAIESPRGTMFVWAPIPEPYEELGSLDFAKLLVRDAKVAVSPGVGFGPAARGTCASRSSRTSSGSVKRSATSGARSTSWARKRSRVSVLYWAMKIVLTPVLRLLYRVHGRRQEHVPSHGPVILAANHRSFLDSIFLPLVIRRRVTYVAKAEYFDDRKTAWFFRGVGQIPIRREGGSASEGALAAATDVLERGGVFGIYPEGTRTRDGYTHRGHTGVARLAARTGAPIIPVGLVGTDECQPTDKKLPRLFRTVHVRFGTTAARSTSQRTATTGIALRAAHRRADVRDRAARRRYEYRDTYATKKAEDSRSTSRRRRVPAGRAGHARRVTRQADVVARPARGRARRRGASSRSGAPTSSASPAGSNAASSRHADGGILR